MGGGVFTDLVSWIHEFDLYILVAPNQEEEDEQYTVQLRPAFPGTGYRTNALAFPIDALGTASTSKDN